MKAQVDADRCSGHGRCFDVALEFYEPDDEGYNAFRGQTVDIPPGMEDAATAGSRHCPEAAIAILD
ncbi:hypothetical protein GCM10009836_61040 [Pseudonocardia ailaonensis]|uniref:Ferredoxin n=1 Tax=Pseudonocardia ailaonensis TaxID=367279 RepID=A0ABN2NNP3_9PSEU